MFVCCECCVLSEVSATDWSLVQTNNRRQVKWWEAPNHFRSSDSYFQSQGQRGVHRGRMSKQTMTGLLPICIRFNSLSVAVCAFIDFSVKHATKPNALHHYAVTDCFCVIWSADLCQTFSVIQSKQPCTIHINRL
jgi:hypothetical protein